MKTDRRFPRIGGSHWSSRHLTSKPGLVTKRPGVDKKHQKSSCESEALHFLLPLRRARLVRRKLGGLAPLKGVCAAMRGFRCQSWFVRRRPSSVGVCVCRLLCVRACVCLSFFVFVCLCVRVSFVVCLRCLFWASCRAAGSGRHGTWRVNRDW